MKIGEGLYSSMNLSLVFSIVIVEFVAEVKRSRWITVQKGS